MSTPVVFLDTEATGVHAGRQVWEIAMIRRQPGALRETTFMVDVDLSAADLFGLDVGRFYERHPGGRYLAGLTAGVAEGATESRADAARMVARWTHKAVIVGAVPNFDTEMLAALLREHHLVPAWHYQPVDVETLAVGYLNGIVEEVGRLPSGVELDDLAPPWDTDKISRALGVEPTPDEERHTALGDARWAMRVYDAVMGVRR